MRYEDEIKGKGKQIKGATKEKLGKLTGDRDLEQSGAGDRFAGKAQEQFGKARRKVGDAVEELGKQIANKR
jgi:uncharacterized protein YjbJ (UPF0337 family)